MTSSRVTLPLQGELNLAKTLTMGQTFCWRELDGWHVGTIDGALVRVKTHGETLIAECDDADGRLAERIGRYFDTTRDLPTLQRELSRDPHVADAIARHPDIRVLRQPLWECLAYFILSSVNNIKRITLIVDRLSSALGELQSFDGRAFPTPERIASVEQSKLYDLGTGFRAKGLQAAARAICDGSLREDELRKASMDDAREALTAIHGVGVKIADCVMLYALDKFAAYPLDVWMRRETQRLYFDGADIPPDEIQAFARERFGEMAGYAQLYLYHAARTRDE